LACWSAGNEPNLAPTNRYRPFSLWQSSRQTVTSRS